MPPKPTVIKPSGTLIWDVKYDYISGYLWSWNILRLDETIKANKASPDPHYNEWVLDWMRRRKAYLEMQRILKGEDEWKITKRTAKL